MNDNQYRNKNVLERLYVDQGLSAKKISKKLGCSKPTILRWLDNHGIKKRTEEEIVKDVYDHNRLLWRDKGWMTEKYVNELLSTKAIARLAGCSPRTIVVWLEKHGIPTRSVSQGNRLVQLEKSKDKIWWNEDWLIENYIEKELSACEMANIAGCGFTTIYSALRRYEIPIRSQRLSNEMRGSIRPHDDPYYTKDWLEKCYIEKEMTYEEMAKKAQCSPKTIGNWLKDFNIEPRSHKVRCINKPTRPEKAFRKALEHEGIKYEPEYIIPGNEREFMYDVYIPSQRILVEIDGEYWHSSEEAMKRDKVKDRLAKENNYNIIRYTDYEILDRANKDSYLYKNFLSGAQAIVQEDILPLLQP